MPNPLGLSGEPKPMVGGFTAAYADATVVVNSDRMM